MCQQLFDNFSTIPTDCKNLSPFAHSAFYVNSPLFAAIFQLSIPVRVCVLVFSHAFWLQLKVCSSFSRCQDSQDSQDIQDCSQAYELPSGAVIKMGWWTITGTVGLWGYVCVCGPLFALVLVICVLCWLFFFAICCCAFFGWRPLAFPCLSFNFYFRCPFEDAFVVGFSVPVFFPRLSQI